MRNRTVDLAKGLGIIMVVLGHSGMPNSSIIFRFHMSLFFILSGWCFNDRHIENLHEFRLFIIKKIKKLYIPFVVFNGLLVLLQNMLIYFNIYTNNPKFLDVPIIGMGNSYGITNTLTFNDGLNLLLKIFAFSGETQLGGATWFIRVLFILTITWGGINLLLKIAKFGDGNRFVFNIILSIFFLIISYKWMQDGKHFFVQIETFMATYILFTFGYYYKSIYKRRTTLQNIFIAILSFSILLYFDTLCNQYGWNSNVNEFVNPAIYITTTLAGFFFTISIAEILCSTVILSKIEYIGKHTMSILLLHFLSFKVVNLFQCLIYKQPLYRVASFPTFCSNNGWWIIYAVTGVLLPLFILWIGFTFWKNIRFNLKGKIDES